jgi:predicted O-methyltransferase YrrM
MAKKSKGMHDFVLRMMEKFFAINFLGRIYTKFFEKMTLNEFKIAEIKENDNILHIGCGAVPNTLLILGSHYNASFVGIDRDKEAVKKARQMVKRYGLEKRIKINGGEAISYPLLTFDILIISLGVEPLEKVFERVRNEMKHGSRIVARKPWDFMDIIYGRKEFIPQGFKVINIVNRPDFIKSVLLKNED